jgi:hypothetical protein
MAGVCEFAESSARLNLRLRVRVCGLAELLAGWQGVRAGKGWQIGGRVIE